MRNLENSVPARLPKRKKEKVAIITINPLPLFSDNLNPLTKWSMQSLLDSRSISLCSFIGTEKEKKMSEMKKKLERKIQNNLSHLQFRSANVISFIFEKDSSRFFKG